MIFQRSLADLLAVLLQRLYRLGYRRNTTHAGRFGLKPEHASAAEKRVSAAEGAEDAEAAASGNRVDPPLGKSSTLPNLTQKVEFFHLTTDDGKDAPPPVELVGVIPGQALIVQCVAEGGAPTLKAGVTYQARLFTGSRLFKFLTELLPEAAGPFGCYFLRYPEAVAQALVRRQQRVTTTFSGELSSGEYQRAAVDVVVENVSTMGAGVSAKEDFLIVGRTARLRVDLAIEHRVRPITVFVEVRNRRQDGERFVYGLEFSRMPEETRRDIKDFVLESLALQ